LLLPSRTYVLSKACISLAISGWLRIRRWSLRCPCSGHAAISSISEACALRLRDRRGPQVSPTDGTPSRRAGRDANTIEVRPHVGQSTQSPSGVRLDGNMTDPNTKAPTIPRRPTSLRPTPNDPPRRISHQVANRQTTAIRVKGRGPSDHAGAFDVDAFEHHF